MRFLSYTSQPILRQAVDDALHALLVAGNRRSRDDDRVAIMHGQGLVLAVGHAGKRRQGLALRPGAHHDDLVLGKVVDVVGIDDIGLVDLEIAELPRDAGVGEHGATGDHDLATALLGGVAYLLETVDMAGEGRDEHAARSVLDRRVQRGADLSLRPGESRDGRVGGIGKQQVDPLLGELVDRRVVGSHAVDGGLVELEVAGVHDGSLRGADEHAERAGDRMRHREEVDGDATEIDMAAAVHLAELGGADTEFGELALDESERQLAGEDGDLVVKVLQEIRERAGVVLVAVRDDDAAELVLVLEDIGVVGQDQVDTGLEVIGEHEAGIDEDHILAALDGGHVLADTVKAAQRNDAERCSFLFSCGCHKRVCAPFGEADTT